MNLLILAGTTEANVLANKIAEAGINAVLSYAGRVERVKPQPLSKRVGGFGGVMGLCAYLKSQAVTHVVDATHPFAVQMSRHAVDACAKVGIPLLAIQRPPWLAQEGDYWIEVNNISEAVKKLGRPRCNVMLALGRKHISKFSIHPQHRYILRLVDPPKNDISLADFECIVSRGPFTYTEDLKLFKKHKINILVSKNSGGSATKSKIEAARTLAFPVVMINRPILHRVRQEVVTVEEAVQWVFHMRKDRGV